MAQIIYEARDQYVIELENYSEEELRNMTDEEIFELVEAVDQGYIEGGYVSNTHVREIAEILNDNNDSIRVVERENE